MKLVNDNRLLGITAGLAFCQTHSPKEIRKELKFLENLTALDNSINESLTGKLYAITWALENSDKVTDKLEECKTELANRKLGGNESHVEALSI